MKQREIKFRFWDKALSKMLYRHLEKYDTEHPEIDVMQFTGLHDKNGVPIYEGDIVMQRNILPCLIDFKQGAFVLKSGNNTAYIWEESDLEIIGNIHQNPELL